MKRLDIYAYLDENGVTRYVGQTWNMKRREGQHWHKDSALNDTRRKGAGYASQNSVGSQRHCGEVVDILFLANFSGLTFESQDTDTF